MGAGQDHVPQARRSSLRSPLRGSVTHTRNIGGMLMIEREAPAERTHAMSVPARIESAIQSIQDPQALADLATLPTDFAPTGTSPTSAESARASSAPTSTTPWDRQSRMPTNPGVSSTWS